MASEAGRGRPGRAHAPRDKGSVSTHPSFFSLSRSSLSVHYDGFLLPGPSATAPPPGATPFYSSRDEAGPSSAPAVVIAGRSAAARETGLAAAAAAMRVGERAQVRATPAHGYGPAGSFSFPSVPPHAHLFYEVELVAAEPPDEGKPLGLMLFEERLEAATRRRAAGNEALQAGDPDAAAASYHLALSFIDDDLLIQLDGRHAQLAEAEVRAARLNLAAAHLKAGRPREAVAECDAVLSAAGAATCPPAAKAKALYRRGLARRTLGAPGDAVADLKAAAAAAPGDPGILAALAGAAAEAKAQDAAGAALFRGALRQRKGREVEQVEEEEVAPGPVQPSGKKASVAGRAWVWAAAALVVAVVGGGLVGWQML